MIQKVLMKKIWMLLSR